MNKSSKIFIIIIFDLLYIFAFVCIFGFTIGGRIGLYYATEISNIRFWAFAIIMTLALVMSNFAVFNGKEIFKSSEERVGIFVAAAVIVMCIYFLYTPMNKFTAQAETTADYDTVVIYEKSLYGIHFFNEVIFENQNKEKVSAIVFDWTGGIDGGFAIDDEIHVKEYQGGFGFPAYDIEILT